LQAIADKSRTSLRSLMSFLSFQDVMRQRAEKVQVMIDSVEEKVRDLLSKFHLKAPESIVEEESDKDFGAQVADHFQEVVDQNSVDDFFK
jgi:chemotaxis regulatin CheY-phosphate phosphatase CheZ